MVDPILALFVFSLLLLVGALILWPDRGIAARINRILGMTQRVRLEDCLKHLYKCELGGRVCSVESTAGTLGISRGQAAELLARLEEMELARASGTNFELTESGRENALHIVRTHRLLERYFADRTGVSPVDWHKQAERREHELSPEDTEALASRLGHPLYDPHGDPIPTRQGDLPPRTGVPITTLEAGEVASIIHLGDEPREIYEALVEAGLSPSMPVKVLESTPGEVRFETEGQVHALSPVVARQITVELLPEAELTGRAMETLADLENGQEARVLGIHTRLQGPQRRRLLDLGLVPGTTVTAELSSAGGDPVAYRIRGALIALREDQARWVQVDRASASDA